MTAITSTPISQPTQPSLKSRLVRDLAKVFNPVLAPMADRGWIGIWGTLEHVGRRTGRTYRTPVAVLASGDLLFVPVPFGTGTQWTQNVLAAGKATIRWHGHDRELVEPRIVEFAEIRDLVHGPIRSLVPLIGIRHFVVARRLPT
jgi:deazaflavin-dependent oxidoreductase (nitroreductase family)